MQQELLGEMLTSGAIIQEEYDLAFNEVITLRKPDSTGHSMAAGFVKQVEKRLENVLSSQRLQRGGLVVLTTLDADLQNQLTCTANTQMIRLAYSNVSGVAPDQPDCDAALLLPTQSFTSQSDTELAAAGLVMNPQTGEVLAYLEPVTLSGERLSDAGYQPGSLLTPIVAVGAFSRGYSPASLVWDIPSTLNLMDEGSTSTAGNYQGAVNIRSAVANDYLNPIANLVMEIGAFNTWRTAAVIGLDSLNNPPDDASPLFGGSESSLLQVGTAYSTLANSGVRSGRLDTVSNEIVPETVLKVTTAGNRVLWQAEAAEKVAIVSDTVTYLVNHVLSDESARWPSLGYPNELEIGSEVAAKTGSADDHRQVWTVGYTPQHLVLVWMGTDGESESLPGLDERMAAGIWHAVFKYTSRQQQFNGWTRPAGITEMQVCSPSGMLPTRDCPNIVYDVFLYGNEPTLPDTLFTRVKVNRETGQLATVFTPPALVEERVYMNIPPEARDWAESAGLAIVPQGYDSIQAVQVDPAANISQPAMFSPVAGRVMIRGTAAGDDFTSYQVQVGEGINPENWLQVNESRREVEEGVLAEWDSSGLNGLFAIRLSVIDSASLVRSAVTQVTVDNTPPSARITYPQDGQTVEPVRGGVTITAAVEDLVGINNVEWWVNGKKVMEQTSPPYLYQLKATSGNHTVYVKAWDTAGNRIQSGTVSFRIQP